MLGFVIPPVITGVAVLMLAGWLVVVAFMFHVFVYNSFVVA
jgi:hypothetical protein